MKQTKILKLLTIFLPIVVVLGMVTIFVQNYLSNTQLRKFELTGEALQDGVYDFGDASVEIVTRGGDSGSWIKDPILDDDGNVLLGSYVGTIYEIVVTNKTADTMSDWEITLYMPEDLLINNS